MLGARHLKPGRILANERQRTREDGHRLAVEGCREVRAIPQLTQRAHVHGRLQHAVRIKRVLHFKHARGVTVHIPYVKQFHACDFVVISDAFYVELHEREAPVRGGVRGWLTVGGHVQVQAEVRDVRPEQLDVRILGLDCAGVCARVVPDLVVPVCVCVCECAPVCVCVYVVLSVRNKVLFRCVCLF